MDKKNEVLKSEKNDRYFEVFLELYNNRKLTFIVRRNSYSMNLESKSLPEDVSNQEIKAFAGNIVNDILKYLNLKKISGDYCEYIEKLKKSHNDLFEQFATRQFSNLNVLSEYDFEVITSKGNKGEKDEEYTTAILKLVYLEPIDRIDSEKAITLELSKLDLIELKNKISQVLDDFN